MSKHQQIMESNQSDEMKLDEMKKLFYEASDWIDKQDKLESTEKIYQKLKVILDHIVELTGRIQ